MSGAAIIHRKLAKIGLIDQRKLKKNFALEGRWRDIIA